MLAILLATLIGALTPHHPNAHAAARAILVTLAAFTMAITSVKAAQVLVGQCHPVRCDDKRGVNIYWDASGTQTTTISGDGCVFFKSSVSKPLWLGGIICNNATMCGANACVSAPDSEGHFRYVCPAK